MASNSTITEASLQGVWKRDWIEVNDERSDSVHVLWAQAADLFVDIRIPYERPDVSRYSCLDDVPIAELKQLKTAEGFAGRIELQNSICTWHREINWRGPPTVTDAGALHFAHDSALIETGVHASYSESWRQTISPPLEAHRFSIPDSDEELQGIVIFSGNHFFFGVGLPVSEKFKKPGRGVSVASTGHYFDSEYCYGKWNGQEGVAVLHTNPFCSQKQVLSSNAGRVVWHRLDSQGNDRSLVLSFAGSASS